MVAINKAWPLREVQNADVHLKERSGTGEPPKRSDSFSNDVSAFYGPVRLRFWLSMNHHIPVTDSLN